MKIITPTISTLSKWKRASVIEEWINQAYKTQNIVWQDLISAGQYTEFGVKYKFSSIQTIKDFQTQVPISSYEELKTYIQKIMDGGENVLWNSPIKWFAKSSGTTSDKSKFIPISEESLKNTHYQASMDLLTIYNSIFVESQLLDGKSLVLGGSHEISSLNENIQCGDLSAVLMQNAPLLGKWIRTPDLSIALLGDWEIKIEELAKNTIKENVTCLAGVPTWTIILIHRILAITGKKYLIDVWPNLEVYMHGGVTFQPYKKNFLQLIGKPINYIDIYNASEGFFAAQNSFTDDSLLLFTNHGIFYEFMPLEEKDKKKPKTLLLNEVKLNTTYALIVTTNGGLWRYSIGDTIMFVSLNPYKIKIIGRLKHFINAFGEELIIDNTDQAICQACFFTNAEIKDYTVAPIYFSENKAQGAHEWLIEFEKQPKDLNLFVKYLDDALQKVNSDYEAKRQKNIALTIPQIINCPKNTFSKWLKSKNKLGGQHKVPRLSNDRTYVDEIKKFL